MYIRVLQVRFIAGDASHVRATQLILGACNRCKRARRWAVCPPNGIAGSAWAVRVRWEHLRDANGVGPVPSLFCGFTRFLFSQRAQFIYLFIHHLLNTISIKGGMGGAGCNMLWQWKRRHLRKSVPTITPPQRNYLMEEKCFDGGRRQC